MQIVTFRGPCPRQKLASYFLMSTYFLVSTEFYQQKTAKRPISEPSLLLRSRLSRKNSTRIGVFSETVRNSGKEERRAREVTLSEGRTSGWTVRIQEPKEFQNRRV
jgi:hypothetical protein